MSEKLCEQGCKRARFEDKTKCIFHCEKDDWFEIVNAPPWNAVKDWSVDQGKTSLFWTEFKKEWRKGNQNYSGFVFPKFEEEIFQNLYQECLKLPHEITTAYDKILVTFENTKFLGEADFRGITFTSPVNFFNANFMDWTNFDNAIFTQEANFNFAAFAQWAHFNNATFNKKVDFNNANFTLGTGFNNATFIKDAYFNNTTFAQWVEFNNATFTGAADFSVDIPIETANKNKNIPAFAGDAFFTEVSFGGETTFESRNFKAQTSFTSADFAQAPNMHGVELYSNTDFTGISCGTAEPIVSHGNYRWLIKKMEDSGDRRAASIFFAAEQHCLLETGMLDQVETVISWFYKSASYYGSRIVLPLGWLLGFQMLFPFLLFKLELPSLSASPHHAFFTFFDYLASIIIADGLIFYFFLRNSKNAEGSAIIGNAPLISAILFNMVLMLCMDSFNWDGYGDNWIMLLTNLFRPFYDWKDACPPHPFHDYLIGLLHLTLVYSAFALLLFAIRRRFKME